MKEGMLQDFINCIQGMFLNVKNVVVIKNGEKVAEKHWDEDVPKNQYSVAKSFASMAIGIAIEEGLLSLDDRVIDFFPEETPSNPQEELKSLKLRHLLLMSTGHFRPLLMGRERWDLEEKNWVKLFLKEPIYHQPGQEFIYSNATSYVAGVMLQKAAGQTLVDYLTPRIFEPLNIKRPKWEVCPQGYTFAAAGLEIETEELSRFGQLCLQNGKWEGKQLIPENWVKSATSKKIDTYGYTDTKEGYGYQFWRCCKENIYRADGKHGQFCIVIPDKDAVVAINSREERTQLILDKVWSEILPQL